MTSQGNALFSPANERWPGTKYVDTLLAGLLLKGKIHVLIVAALLIFAIGLIHSYLGERYILMRLFRQPLPELFGSDHFTKQTLRFAWHVTTVAWAGFAFLLIALNRGELVPSQILNIIGVTFAITGTIALVASRGKHLSWTVFGTIAAICFVATA